MTVRTMRDDSDFTITQIISLPSFSRREPEPDRRADSPAKARRKLKSSLKFYSKPCRFEEESIIAGSQRPFHFVWFRHNNFSNQYLVFPDSEATSFRLNFDNVIICGHKTKFLRVSTLENEAAPRADNEIEAEREASPSRVSPTLALHFTRQLWLVSC